MARLIPNNLLKTTFFLALFTLAIQASPVKAAPLETLSNQISRINEATEADHEILFSTPTGVAAGQTIVVTFPTSTFTFGASYDYTDMALAEGDSSNCDTASYTPKTLAGSASGTTWGASYSADVVTFTSGTGTITADRCVRINLNSNSGVHQLTNPTVGSNTSYSMNIAAGTNDEGNLAVVILDDAGTPDGDQVQITATLQSAISFDLDVATTNCENSTETTPASNTVALGSLSPGQVNVSSSSVNFVCMDVGTNNNAGVRVLIRSSRSDPVGGLVNGATADVIESNTADLNSGGTTSGYGVRVSAVGTPDFGTFTAQSPFNNGSVANVGQLPGTTASSAYLVGSTVAAQTGTSSRIAVEVAAKSNIGHDPGGYSDTLVFSALINF